MWLLNWLPNWVFHLILLVGVLGLVASFVLKFIPFVDQYRIPIQVAAILLTILGVWYEGGIAKDREYQERIAALELKVSRAETAAAEANTRLVESLAKKDQEIKEVTTANQQRLRDLAAQLNKTCTVNQDVVNILNNAARNRKDTK